MVKTNRRAIQPTNSLLAARLTRMSSQMSSEPNRPLARRIRDRIDASDPGGFAGRTALRAALALAAAALLLLAFGASFGDPVLLAIVGGEIAMMTSSSVSDP